MLSWFRQRFSHAGPERTVRSLDVSRHDSGVDDRDPVTHDGDTDIPELVPSADPVADAFERRLITWLTTSVNVRPVMRTGTGALYWTFQYQEQDVALVVVGHGKNGMPPAEGTDWLLRVEEAKPFSFLPKLESCFQPADRLKRKMHDGKVRIQFKSTELLPDSELGRPEAGNGGLQPSSKRIRLRLEPGVSIGEYKIIRKLGEGGFGEVYLALDLRTNEAWALKTIHKKLLNNPTQLAAFRRELRVWVDTHYRLWSVESSQSPYYRLISLQKG